MGPLPVGHPGSNLALPRHCGATPTLGPQPPRVQSKNQAIGSQNWGDGCLQVTWELTGALGPLDLRDLFWKWDLGVWACPGLSGSEVWEALD